MGPGSPRTVRAERVPEFLDTGGRDGHTAQPHAAILRYVHWVANKRFEISKFKFKIPRARTSELQGSFSAVSKPNFASKYSLESSRRDLHNALLCTVL